MRLQPRLALALAVAALCAAAVQLPAAAAGDTETKTADVLDMSKIEAALTADVLKELGDAEDESSVVHKLTGKKLKNKLLGLAKAAEPVFDAFFENQEQLWKDNAKIATFTGVSPKVKDAKKGLFHEGTFVVTVGVGSEADLGKVKWGNVPKDMRQVEVFERVTEKDLVDGDEPADPPLLAKNAKKGGGGLLAPPKTPGHLVQKKSSMPRGPRTVAAAAALLSLKERVDAAAGAGAAINANQAYVGTRMKVSGAGTSGSLGYIVYRGGNPYAVTNGHVCGTPAGSLMAARTFANAYVNLGNSLASVRDRSSDTCIAAWGAGGVPPHACDTRDGAHVPKDFTRIPNALSALNMLVGRRVTQYGPRPKGVSGANPKAVQRSYAKIRYWGFRSGFLAGQPKSWGQYVALPYDPTTWFDNSGAVDFGVGGDSGTGVMSMAPSGTRTVGQYWGSKKPPRLFRRYYIAPIHKHRRIWETAVGGAVTLCP